MGSEGIRDGLEPSGLLPKEPKPSCEERRAGQKKAEETVSFFCHPRRAESVGMEGSCRIRCKRNLPEASHSPAEGKALYMQNIKQEQAQSRRGDGAVTFWCRRILLQEPRGKLSQGTRTRGGQPVVELVALVMEQQRMRVTSQ